MSSTSTSPVEKFDVDGMDNEAQDRIVKTARADESVENTYSGVCIDTFEGEKADLQKYHSNDHESSITVPCKGKPVLRLPRSHGL